MKMLLPVLLLSALLVPTRPLSAQCGGDPGYVLGLTTTAPNQLAIGEPFSVQLAVPQASFALLLASAGPGPTSSPFGDLCLDMPPFVIYGFPLPGEQLNVPCQMPCDDAALGFKAYLQFVAFSFATPRSVGRSNMVCVEIVDAGRCDDFNGCTPGYWKQSHHAYPAPYTHSNQFSSVFEDAFPGMTLQEVAQKDSGGGVSRLEILGAHTVAAFLNAVSGGVNYPLTPAEVVQRFNDVFPGSDAEYLALKDAFEAMNEVNCPL